MSRVRIHHVSACLLEEKLGAQEGGWSLSCGPELTGDDQQGSGGHRGPSHARGVQEGQQDWDARRCVLLPALGTVTLRNHRTETIYKRQLPARGQSLSSDGGLRPPAQEAACSPSIVWTPLF